MCTLCKPMTEEPLAVAEEFAAQLVEQEVVASTAAEAVVVVALVVAAAAEGPELAELEVEIAKSDG